MFASYVWNVSYVCPGSSFYINLHSRFKADVRGKDVKLGKVHKAVVNKIVWEETSNLSLVSDEKLSQATLVLPSFAMINECKVNKNKDDNCRMIYKNTKYFCRKCDIYICNGCFSSDCMNHDVQWIGNATFVCESFYHKPLIIQT